MIEVGGVQSFQRLLYETLGISFNVSYSELEREFWQAAVTSTPTDGIFDVLDTLEKYRIKTGILSNSAWTGAGPEGVIKLAAESSPLLRICQYTYIVNQRK